MNPVVCLTTFLRDDLLYKSVDSVLNNSDYDILIGDQLYTEEKFNYFKTLDRCYYVGMKYDCGLSKSRNRLVELAKKLEYEHCIITQDSFLFNNKTKNGIEKSIEFLKRNEDYGIVGGKINNRSSWEFNINKTDRFILSPIEKTDEEFIDTDIVHNFFVGNIRYILDFKWDDNLKLLEHIDFFWRFKQLYKTAYCSEIEADYIHERNNSYNKYRNRAKKVYESMVIKKYKLHKYLEIKDE